MELRRGCPNKCVFCQTPCIFPIIREHSVEYVLKYSKYIKDAGRERVFFTISDALACGSKNG
ncbi:MAG: radical SAM protein, partial [Elusimicrobiota bacterium]